MLAPTNMKNAEFGGPGQRTQGREDVCFHAFHVSHRRKGDSEAPKSKQNADTRLQVILALVYGFPDHRRAGRVEKYPLPRKNRGRTAGPPPPPTILSRGVQITYVHLGYT